MTGHTKLNGASGVSPSQVSMVVIIGTVDSKELKLSNYKCFQQHDM
jgi:hypothetical protein